MFIFDRCCRSSAAVTPVKYECDANNLTGTFARSKILLTDKLTNGALVSPTPGPVRSSYPHNGTFILLRWNLYAEAVLILFTNETLTSQADWINYHYWCTMTLQVKRLSEKSKTCYLNNKLNTNKCGIVTRHAFSSKDVGACIRFKAAIIVCMPLRISIQILLLVYIFRATYLIPCDSPSIQVLMSKWYTR